MKTNILFPAIIAIVLSASFSASAKANDIPSDSASESSIHYVVDRIDRVSSNSTDTWTFTLLQGESYTIVVEGDGDTDLDTYLYDENDHEIDKDTDSTDYCVCYVTPKWTGEFKLKIKNYGSVYNEYNLRVYR